MLKKTDDLSLRQKQPENYVKYVLLVFLTFEQMKSNQSIDISTNAGIFGDELFISLCYLSSSTENCRVGWWWWWLVDLFPSEACHHWVTGISLSLFLVAWKPFSPGSRTPNNETTCS